MFSSPEVRRRLVNPTVTVLIHRVTHFTDTRTDHDVRVVAVQGVANVSRGVITGAEVHALNWIAVAVAIIVAEVWRPIVLVDRTVAILISSATRVEQPSRAIPPRKDGSGRLTRAGPGSIDASLTHPATVSHEGTGWTAVTHLSDRARAANTFHAIAVVVSSHVANLNRAWMHRGAIGWPVVAIAG